MPPIAVPARPFSYWAPHWRPATFASLRGELESPEFLGDEVEIARLVVDALVPELFSLRARRSRIGRPYRYRLVDTVGTDFLLPRQRSAGPLAHDEVVALLDGVSAHALPHAGRPFVERVTHATLDAGTVTPKEAATALRVESAVYASLASAYAPRIAAAIRAWVAASAPG